MRIGRAFAAVAVALVSACNPTPSQPRTRPTYSPPSASEAIRADASWPEASVASPAPSASAPQSASPLPPLPPAPAATETSGAAAIVWIADDKVPGGFRSDWIEPDGQGAKLRLQRKDAVVAGAAELWTIGYRKVTLNLPPCSDPNTQCNPHPELTEPYLRSLKNNRKLRPWKSDFEDFGGCDADQRDSIEGMVGSVIFLSSWRVENACGAACAMHFGGFSTVDVDAGGGIKLEFPAEIKGLLRERASAELNADEKALCGELNEYRVTAAYDDRGELEAEYEFGDNHAGLCGSAQHCPNPRQRTRWLPKPLARWGKLPSWTASYMATVHSSYASMIPASRVAAARAEFGKP